MTRGRRQPAVVRPGVGRRLRGVPEPPAGRAGATLEPERRPASTLFALPDLRRRPTPTLAPSATRSCAARSTGADRALRVAVEHTWLLGAGPRAPSRPAPPRRRHDAARSSRRPGVLTIHDLQYLALPASSSARLKLTWLATAVPTVGAPGRRRHRAERVREGQRGRRRSATRPSASWSCPTASTRSASAPPRADGRGRAPGRATGCPGRSSLYPAITHPHKNHVVLLRAVRRAWAPTPPTSGSCCSAGRGPAEDDVTAEIDAPRPRRRVSCGPVGCPTPTATACTALATVLAFPSRYEGFGAPVLEAMAAGCPVVAADATALPEVVGDAGARCVDPTDVDGLAAMPWRRLLDDDAERCRLAAAGRARAATFTADGRRRGPLRRPPTVSRARMKLAVLCPHFAPDVAPTGEVITRIVAELAGAATAAARRDGAALVRAPPGRAGVAGPARAAAERDRRGARSRGCTRSRPTSGRSPAGPSPSAAFSAPGRRSPALRGGRVDGVLAMSPPLTLGLTGWGMARAARAPLVFNIQDVFPDVAVELGAITNDRVIARRPPARAGQLPGRRRRHRAVRRPARQRRRQAARRRAPPRSGSSRTSSTPTPIRPLDRRTAYRRRARASATRRW